MSNVAQNLASRLGNDFSDKVRVDAGLDNYTWSNGAQTLAGQAATGGTGPYTYLWEVISGSGTFSDATSLTSTFSPDTLGAHVLRLTATDSLAATGHDSVTLEISSPWDLLDLYIKDYWDSEAGISLVSGAVDTWTGQKLGVVLSAAAAGNRPVYGADSTHFNSKSVVQCATTGSKYLRILDYGSDLMTAGAGQNPYLFLVARMRTAVPAAAAWTIVVGPASSSVHVGTYYDITTAQDVGFVRDAGPANRQVNGAAYVSTPVFLEVWSASGANIRKNMGTTYTTAGTDGIDSVIGNVRRIGLGARGDGFAPGDVSVRFAAFLTSKPSDTMLTSVYNYFQTDSGF